MRISPLSLVFALTGVTSIWGGAAVAARFDAVPLPLEGDGYEVPATWAERGLSFGTAELVGLIERAARTVHDDDYEATLYVADLSRQDGRRTQWHASHRNGHDADLIYYALDDEGNPAPEPDHMIAYGPDGWSLDGTRRFDAAKNWRLVRALVEDGRVRVTKLFMAAVIQRQLLAYAEEEGEDPQVIARVAEVMAQPGDSGPHNDHMHVRIEGWEPGGSLREWARAARKHGAVKHARHVARHKGTAKKAKRTARQ